MLTSERSAVFATDTAPVPYLTVCGPEYDLPDEVSQASKGCLHGAQDDHDDA